MGAAKRRGSFEQRKAKAIVRQQEEADAAEEAEMARREAEMNNPQPRRRSNGKFAALLAMTAMLPEMR